VNGLSVIIPSATYENAEACVRAVREFGETCRIIVVDDFFYRPLAFSTYPYLFQREPRPQFESGEKPFIFARNMNIGIRAAGTDDVLLLNDDAQLRTPGGFSLLQRAAEEHKEFGLIASTTNVVGELSQTPQGIGLREARDRGNGVRMVCFVAVLIPRRTIDAVGLLDERFVGYGLDDDDYCLRVRNSGLKIGVHDGCFVDHGSLTSSYRGPAGAGGNFIPNLRIFEQKWGVDNWGNPPGTFKG
jgi:GT2 family glycosyltransferase